MTEKEKLRALVNNIDNVIVPSFEDKDLQIIANTVDEGLKLIIEWVKLEGNKNYKP